MSLNHPKPSKTQQSTQQRALENERKEKAANNHAESRASHRRGASVEASGTARGNPGGVDKRLREIEDRIAAAPPLKVPSGRGGGK